MILLDTTVLIEIFDKRSETGEQAYQKLIKNGEEAITSAVNLHEALVGMLDYEGKEEAVSQLLALQVLPYGRSDSVLSAGLERYTEVSGKRIVKADAMIAAIAINNNAKLFTLDKKHFPLLKEKGLQLFE